MLAGLGHGAVARAVPEKDELSQSRFLRITSLSPTRAFEAPVAWSQPPGWPASANRAEGGARSPDFRAQRFVRVLRSPVASPAGRELPPSPQETLQDWQALVPPTPLRSRRKLHTRVLADGKHGTEEEKSQCVAPMKEKQTPMTTTTSCRAFASPIAKTVETLSSLCRSQEEQAPMTTTTGCRAFASPGAIPVERLSTLGRSQEDPAPLTTTASCRAYPPPCAIPVVARSSTPFTGEATSCKTLPVYATPFHGRRLSTPCISTNSLVQRHDATWGTYWQGTPELLGEGTQSWRQADSSRQQLMRIECVVGKPAVEEDVRTSVPAEAVAAATSCSRPAEEEDRHTLLQSTDTSAPRGIEPHFDGDGALRSPGTLFSGVVKAQDRQGLQSLDASASRLGKNPRDRDGLLSPGMSRSRGAARSSSSDHVLPRFDNVGLDCDLHSIVETLRRQPACSGPAQVVDDSLRGLHRQQQQTEDSGSHGSSSVETLPPPPPPSGGWEPIAKTSSSETLPPPPRSGIFDVDDVQLGYSSTSWLCSFQPSSASKGQAGGDDLNDKAGAMSSSRTGMESDASTTASSAANSITISAASSAANSITISAASSAANSVTSSAANSTGNLATDSTASSAANSTASSAASSTASSTASSAASSPAETRRDSACSEEHVDASAASVNRGPDDVVASCADRCGAQAELPAYPENKMSPSCSTVSRSSGESSLSQSSRSFSPRMKASARQRSQSVASPRGPPVKRLCKGSLGADESRALAMELLFASMPRENVADLEVMMLDNEESRHRFLECVRRDGNRWSQVRVAWHLTSSEQAVSSIMKTGICCDEDRCSCGRYGRGGYVALSAAKANAYADSDGEGGIRQLFLVLSLPDEDLVVGERGVRHPRTSADSKAHPTEYCFVDAARLHCAFLLKYCWVPTGRREKLTTAGSRVSHIVQPRRSISPDLCSPTVTCRPHPAVGGVGRRSSFDLGSPTQTCRTQHAMGSVQRRSSFDLGSPTVVCRQPSTIGVGRRASLDLSSPTITCRPHPSPGGAGRRSSIDLGSPTITCRPHPSPAAARRSSPEFATPTSSMKWRG